MDQHVYDMVKLQGLFDILSGLQNKGLRPWCDNLVSLALKQVCYPDDVIAMGWEQRAFLLKGLADIFAFSQGRARTAPEALLELTFSLTAEMKSKFPSNSYGDPSGFKPCMAIAVSALCKLLVLHHQNDALPGSDVSVSVRSVREALSSSLRELAASCIAYIPYLGPQASADLAEASSVIGGGVTWAMMKASWVNDECILRVISGHEFIFITHCALQTGIFRRGRSQSQLRFLGFSIGLWHVIYV